MHEEYDAKYFLHSRMAVKKFNHPSSAPKTYDVILVATDIIRVVVIITIRNTYPTYLGDVPVGWGGSAIISDTTTRLVYQHLRYTDPQIDLAILPADERRILELILETPGITQQEVVTRRGSPKRRSVRR